jgi:multiple sugar transport system ATP-binding protein
MASISVEGASRRFADGTRALDGVSLGVADGEFLVLVGPSGCGKSTLLRAVAGLETLDSGRVLIGGSDVTARPAGERDIAMVFQSYALYPQMTVRDNIEFGLKSRRMRASERQERVADVAALLGLGSLLSRRPAELSGGQLQRVAMGRAIARRPQAFLMDEPLSNLDAQLRSSMRAELIRMRERLKVTTIYVTHDQVEAMTLGERVAVMREGTIQQCDTPRRLFDLPCNTFVATFIGSPPMNLLKADRSSAGIRFGRFELPLDGGARIPGEIPASLLVGLRPGDIAHDRGAPGHWPRIDVMPNAIEEHGHERIVRFRYDAAAESGSEGSAAALLGGRDAVTVGERLRLAVDTAHLHYFDPESGNALARD